MSITRTPVGGGTDFSKFTPVPANGTVTPSSGNSYTTIFSATGKGKISSALARAGTGTAKIKITLDGQVKFWSNQTIVNRVTGIVQEKYVRQASASDATLLCRVNTQADGSVMAGGLISYPKTVETEGACILGDDLYFNTSAIVEVSNSGTNITAYSVQAAVI